MSDTPSIAASETTPEDDGVAVRPHSRGNRVTIVPPDEFVALSELTGKPVADLIATVIKRECAVIRARASTLIEG